MDYSHYAKVESYTRLYRLFYPILGLFVGRLKILSAQGYDPSRTFMFGFSFGARLCLEAGEAMGNQAYEAMDRKYKSRQLNLLGSTPEFLDSTPDSQPALLPCNMPKWN